MKNHGMSHRWIRRSVSPFTLLVLAALLLAACGGASPATTTAPTTAAGAPTAATAAEPTAAPAAAATGKITFYPQEYYSPDSQPDAAKETQALMKEYMEKKPGVTVELVPNVPTGTNYDVWFSTRLSAGQAPNIAWRQFYDRNREASKVWVPLNEYLNKPNPYVEAGQPGSEKWSDSFPDFVMAQTRAGDGNWYQVSLDWVETGLYYNKEVLQKAGVEANWKDWPSFIASCDKLRSAGVEPMGVFMTPDWSTYQWVDAVLITSAYSERATDFYIEKYSSPSLPWRQLVQEELAKAIKDGTFSTKDPEFDQYLTWTKELADKCLVKGFTGIKDYDAMSRLFVEGKVAMAWLGTWTAATLQKDVKFDAGVTYLPPIKGDTSYRVGGPSSTGQYGITQDTAKAGLTDAAVDLLMYWSAPQNFQRVYDKNPSNVPMIAGTEPSEIAKGFDFVAKMPERMLTDPIGRLSPQYGTEHNRIFQRFMLGEMTADQAKTELQAALDKAVTTLCGEQKWDWCDS